MSKDHLLWLVMGQMADWNGYRVSMKMIECKTVVQNVSNKNTRQSTYLEKCWASISEFSDDRETDECLFRLCWLLCSTNIKKPISSSF